MLRFPAAGSHRYDNIPMNPTPLRLMFIRVFTEAVRLAPDDARIQANLDRARAMR